MYICCIISTILFVASSLIYSSFLSVPAGSAYNAATPTQSSLNNSFTDNSFTDKGNMAKKPSFESETGGIIRLAKGDNNPPWAALHYTIKAELTKGNPLQHLSFKVQLQTAKHHHHRRLKNHMQEFKNLGARETQFYSYIHKQNKKRKKSSVDACPPSLPPFFMVVHTEVVSRQHRP